jgi:hypothetical protein
VSDPEHRRPRAQWSAARTFLFLIMTLAAAVLAWYVAGYLALTVVVILGLLIVSYLGTDRVANWRTGRPSRARRQNSEGLLVPPEHSGQLRAEPDVVESWLRERSLDGFFDDRRDG